MNVQITLLPENRILEVPRGETLLVALRRNGVFIDAPCGGAGTCGKCLVYVDGELSYACHTIADRDMTVSRVFPRETAEYEKSTDTTARNSAEYKKSTNHGSSGHDRDGSQKRPQTSDDTMRLSALPPSGPLGFGIDLGTTTAVVFLVNEAGETLAKASDINAQSSFGADVVTRIQNALKGEAEALTAAVRRQLNSLMAECIVEAFPEHVREAESLVKTVALVGNPAMQQLFLGLPVDNLARVPFNPVLTEPAVSDAKDIFPDYPNAKLLTVPDIAGYVGADTVACALALGMAEKEQITLMIDIGTNGEILLGNREKLMATATAAGPALEGANISKGMRASKGAIDHVSGARCHVIGDGEAVGICGSGLIDAVAASLEAGYLNTRGRILPAADPSQKAIPLSGSVSLTQQDIRELQLAKGAISAGIELLTKSYGITCDEIQEVLLAGAFGSFMDPESALAIGLLPEALRGKIRAVGNAAGSGARMLAASPALLEKAAAIAHKTRFLELSTLPDFQMTFAMKMYFREEESE